MTKQTSLQKQAAAAQQRVQALKQQRLQLQQAIEAERKLQRQYTCQLASSDNAILKVLAHWEQEAQMSAVPTADAAPGQGPPAEGAPLAVPVEMVLQLAQPPAAAGLGPLGLVGAEGVLGAGGHWLQPAADLQIAAPQEAFGAGEIIREQAAARLQHSWQVQVSLMADAVMGANNRGSGGSGGSGGSSGSNSIGLTNAAGGTAQLQHALKGYMAAAEAVLHSCYKRGDFNLLCRVLYTRPRGPLLELPSMPGMALPVATSLLLSGADAPLRRLGSSAAADVTARALQQLPAAAPEPQAAPEDPLLAAPLPADFMGDDQDLDALMSGDLDSWELLGDEVGDALSGLQADVPADRRAPTPALEDVFDYLEVNDPAPQQPQLPWEHPSVVASNPGLYLGSAVQPGLDAVLRVLQLTPEQASSLAASYHSMQQKQAAAAAVGPVLGAPWVPLSSAAGWRHPVTQRLLQESLAFKEFIWAWLGPQSPLSLEQRVVACIASYPAMPDVLGWAEELMRQCTPTA